MCIRGCYALGFLVCLRFIISIIWVTWSPSWSTSSTSTSISCKSSAVLSCSNGLFLKRGLFSYVRWYFISCVYIDSLFEWGDWLFVVDEGYWFGFALIMDGLWNVQGSVSFGSDGVLVELNFESLLEGVV